MQQQYFGTTAQGEQVGQLIISGGGLTASLIEYGATLQDLRLEGVGHPLVLGAEKISTYEGPMRYFGAIVGQVANRISNARFQLDGQIYHLPKNFKGRHTLHSGAAGTATRKWRLTNSTENSASFSIALANGPGRFPGNLDVRASYTLPGDGVLEIEIVAHTDARTPCSFAHHSFFNLGDDASITAYLLGVEASEYLPIDGDKLPTGEVREVAGSRFDFRTPRAVGGADLDHNFCLSSAIRPLRKVASLTAPRAGLGLEVETTETGLQVYNGAQIPKIENEGLEGRSYGPYSGLALETQGWPDAVNRLRFPQVFLSPEATYKHVVRYCFSRR